MVSISLPAVSHAPADRSNGKVKAHLETVFYPSEKFKIFQNPLCT